MTSLLSASIAVQTPSVTDAGHAQQMLGDVPFLGANKGPEFIAHAFMHEVAERLAGRVQITSDGFRCYPSAIANAFSKRLENHKHSVALHYFHYNFIRRHSDEQDDPSGNGGCARS